MRFAIGSGEGAAGSLAADVWESIVTSASGIAENLFVYGITGAGCNGRARVRAAGYIIGVSSGIAVPAGSPATPRGA